nr:hypothetical protein [Tanacetum cinerariifolium]
MSPKMMKRKAVKKMVKKWIAEAIEEYEKTREQVFKISKCAEEDKVMFAASTFEGRVLTWWNRNVQTLGLLNANKIPWNKFKSMMTMEYCPGTEIQRMEEELWTLKGDDIEAYNNRFHELALMCPELVPIEKKKVDRYIKGFPGRIKGNIISSKPTTLHKAINMVRELVEQAVQAPWCQFVVGVSDEDDGSSVRGSGVEQEVGKRGYGGWRENSDVRATIFRNSTHRVNGGFRYCVRATYRRSQTYNANETGNQTHTIRHEYRLEQGSRKTSRTVKILEAQREAAKDFKAPAEWL